MARSSTWCSLRKKGPAWRCAVIYRSGGYCAWCGCAVAVRSCQLDHVVPRAARGSDGADNLVLACPTCNLDRPEVTAKHMAGVRALLAQPLDLAAGLQLALLFYPVWMAERLRDRDRRRKDYALRKCATDALAVAEGLGGAAFPFGEVCTAAS